MTMQRRYKPREYRWYVHFPGDAYAMNWDSKTAGTERQVREELREWEHVTRLPVGVQVWRNAD